MITCVSDKSFGLVGICQTGLEGNTAVKRQWDILGFIVPTIDGTSSHSLTGIFIFHMALDISKNVCTCVC
jgi:hypothetical protein